MDANLQRRVQRYSWDKASQYYEAYWQRQLQPAQDWLLEAAKARAGESVLDIASGTGLLTFPLAKQVGDSGTVLGTDISENMISISRKLAEERGFTNLRFERMDGEVMEIADASFDLVICSLGLMYMPLPGMAIAEMFRILKSGGRMYSLVWGERSQCGWAELFTIIESKVASEVCPLFFQLGGVSVLELHMHKAGFTRTHIERMKVNLHYDSAEEACGAAFAGGPVAMAYSRFSKQTKTQAHREYLESIAIFEKKGGYDVPGEFVLASGFK